jgi:HK97 family phage major capsid protein
MNAAATSETTPLELLYRFAQVEPVDADALERAGAKKTLRVAFSSETPVLRSERGKKYYEILDHAPENTDLSLLQDGGAFLDEHNPSKQPGSVERAWIDPDKKGRADLSFANTALGRERWTLMSEGHRKDISFGYIHTRVLSETRGADGIPVRRFAWAAHEITTTACGADHFGTGVGRSQQRKKQNSMETENQRTPIEVLNEIDARAKMLMQDFPHLAEQIRSAKHRAISENEEPHVFSRGIVEIARKTPAPREKLYPVPPGEIGMGNRDIEQYSLHRALRNIASGNGKMEDCYELDVSRQVEKNFGSAGEGFFVPMDIVLGGSRRSYMERDMTAGDFPTGGAAVQTTVMPFIDILRNRTVVTRLGATFLGGLTSNIAFPREIAPVTAQSVSEVGVLADSNPELDQIRLVPHRVGVSVTYSRQLVFQSTPDIEALIRNDTMAQVAVKHDALFLNGQGANDEPMGLLNTIGLNTILFGGAGSYSKIVDFETAVGKANADMGNLAYCTTPGTRGALKKIAVALTGATTVSSRSIWEDGRFNDGSNDGLVNGYRAASTNNVPNDRVIYGNWNDWLAAYFGGFNVIFDPYSSAKKGQIVLTINTWIDGAARHAQSFTVSGDAGSQ